MKKTILLSFFSIIVGISLSIIFFKQYDNNSTFVLASTNTNKYYFIGLGTYSSYDSMINNTNKITEFIYTNDNDNYYVFSCITKNIENLEKIEGYYKDMGYITYRKEFNLSEKELDRQITSIDLLLANTDDSTVIQRLCKESILTYKEG